MEKYKDFHLTKPEKVTLKDFEPDNIPIEKQVDLLAQFLLENFDKDFGVEGKGEGAIEMAVRLLINIQ